MTICLLLIGDGREDYAERTLVSAAENLPDFDYTVEVDDTDHKLGFAGAIQAGWELALTTDADFIFHLELDFTFNRPVPIDEMRATLERHRYLAQMALLRQPWNDRERKAGGIIQADPGNFAFNDGWIQHAKFFTTNPSLYPRWVAERGWPQGQQSEGHFSLKLFASDPKIRSAFWGDGSEWVTHIGNERQGTGY